MIRAVESAKAAIARFALAPASTRPLAALRIGIAGVLLVQGLSALPALFALYGDHGVLAHGAPASEAMFHHVSALLGAIGVREGQALSVASVAYLAALAALLVGAKPRVAAGVAWILHAILLGRAPGERHGADEIARMALFYLVWAPKGAAISLAKEPSPATESANPSPDTNASPSARIALRVLQIHLCMIQGSSGVEKAFGEAWRNGEAVWRALMLPEYQRFDFSFLAAHPWIPAIAGWAVFLFEIGYPILVWPRRTRIPAVVVTSIVHLGIAALMGLTSFSALMIILTIAAFAIPAEPDRRGSIGEAPRPPSF